MNRAGTVIPCTTIWPGCRRLPGCRVRRLRPFCWRPWESGRRISFCLAAPPPMPGPGTSRLTFPSAPDWLPLADRLSRLLNFLTGDDWTLKLREASLDLGLKGEWPHAWRPDGVMLFSGGLDSLVGALDYLEAGERLLLVSHYDFGQLASHPADPGRGPESPLRPRPGAPPGAPGAVSRGPGAVHAEPVPALPGPGAGRGCKLWRRHPPHHPGKRLDQSQSAPDDQPPGQLQHPHHPPLLSGAAHGPLAGSGPGQSPGQPLQRPHQGRGGAPLPQPGPPGATLRGERLLRPAGGLPLAGKGRRCPAATAIPA